MQFQFNLFGFEIQVSRPDCYRVSVIADDDERECVFDLFAATFPGAYLLGWRRARYFALLENRTQTFTVFRMPRFYRDPDRFVMAGCISKKSVIRFFPTVTFK
jgi:hypothetical protein